MLTGLKLSVLLASLQRHSLEILANTWTTMWRLSFSKRLDSSAADDKRGGDGGRNSNPEARIALLAT